MTSSQPWLVATDIRGAGGIASVLRVYEASGFIDRWGVRVLASHCEGGALTKLSIFLKSLFVFLVAVLRGKVCLLHVHSASHGSFWRKACFIGLARIARVPVLFHLHGGGFREFYEVESGKFGQWMIGCVLRRVAAFVVLVENWRDFASRLAPQACVEVLPNPVRVPEVRVMRTDGPPVVLFLGLINERKGVFDLLEAMPAVLARHPECRFVVAGRGEVEGLRARARERGVSESLETPGWVTGVDKDELLAQASVFVLPSYFEAMPMSLLEAMAHGIPCLASRVGGIPDILEDDVEGRLLAPGEPAVWAEALNALLASPEKANQMATAGRERALREFSSEAGMQRLDRLYERWCSRNQAHVALMDGIHIRVATKDDE